MHTCLSRVRRRDADQRDAPFGVILPLQASDYKLHRNYGRAMRTGTRVSIAALLWWRWLRTTSSVVPGRVQAKSRVQRARGRLSWRAAVTGTYQRMAHAALASSTARSTLPISLHLAVCSRPALAAHALWAARKRDHRSYNHIGPGLWLCRRLRGGRLQQVQRAHVGTRSTRRRRLRPQRRTH